MSAIDARITMGNSAAASMSKLASSARDPRLVQALEEYLAALETGTAPDRQQFRRRNADIAAALAECLDGLDFIRSATAQVREPALGHAITSPLEGPARESHVRLEAGGRAMSSSQSDELKPEG